MRHDPEEVHKVGERDRLKVLMVLFQADVWCLKEQNEDRARLTRCEGVSGDMEEQDLQNTRTLVNL